jgi:hypothetical protein
VSARDDGAEARAVADLIERLPKALADGDLSVLSSAARQRGTDLRQAVPAGSTLSVDRSSWQRTGVLGSASADLVINGEQPRSFIVVVVWEEGAWRVSSTYQLGGL